LRLLRLDLEVFFLGTAMINSEGSIHNLSILVDRWSVINC
jgi:hypothetical protein